MLHIFKRVPSKISTIMIAFDAGARAEGDKFSPGLAHMLEHMVFKGTDTRHYLDIPREVGFLGGNINAFTSQELVGFYISVPYENVEKAMDILSDIVFNSTFPEEEFLKEREVVKEEELSSKDSVDSFIWNEFIKEFYQGRSSSPVIGTQDSISGFTTDEIRSFYKKYYSKSGAIVSFCGNHSKREGKRLLTKYFGRSSGKMRHDVEVVEPVYKESRTITITRPKLEHTYVWMCYPGLPINSGNEAAHDMMMSILSQGMDSRLFTEVREKRGLCYSISGHAISQRDYSSTLITTSTRSSNADEMCNLISKEIERLKTELVTKEEMERVRNKFRASSYAVTERSHSLAKTSLTRAFFGLSTLEELEEEANSVTEEDIRMAAIKAFDTSRMLKLICEEESNED